MPPVYIHPLLHVHSCSDVKTTECTFETTGNSEITVACVLHMSFMYSWNLRCIRRVLCPRKRIKNEPRAFPIISNIFTNLLSNFQHLLSAMLRRGANQLRILHPCKNIACTSSRHFFSSRAHAQIEKCIPEALWFSENKQWNISKYDNRIGPGFIRRSIWRFCFLAMNGGVSKPMLPLSTFLPY